MYKLSLLHTATHFPTLSLEKFRKFQWCRSILLNPFPLVSKPPKGFRTLSVIHFRGRWSKRLRKDIFENPSQTRSKAWLFEGLVRTKPKPLECRQRCLTRFIALVIYEILRVPIGSFIAIRGPFELRTEERVERFVLTPQVCTHAKGRAKRDPSASDGAQAKCRCCWFPSKKITDIFGHCPQFLMP